MAGRFPLYTDTDIDGPVVKALRAAAWDILRGIDAYPEKTATTSISRARCPIEDAAHDLSRSRLAVASNVLVDVTRLSGAASPEPTCE